MTDFKVTDEAVETAASAFDRFPLSAPDSEVFRAVLEESIPAMLELIGWQSRLTHSGGFTVWKWSGDTEEMEWLKSLYAANDALGRIEFRAVYAIKEPK